MKKLSITGSVLVFISAFLFIFPTIVDVYLFDDLLVIKDSSAFKTLDQVPGFFTGNIFSGTKDWAPLYRPLLMVSLFVNRVVFGHSAIAYHIINVLLHALASLLLYHVLACFLGYSYRSLIPAILFAVHPVHIDAVAFIINRSEILGLIFILLALLFLARDGVWKSHLSFESQDYGAVGKRWFFVILISALFYFLALLSKETSACTLGVLFLVILMKIMMEKRFLPFRPVGAGLILLSVTLILYLVIRYLAVGGIGFDPKLTFFYDRSLVTIIPTMGRVFAEYILLLVSPVYLRVDYSDYVMSHGFFEKYVILSLLLHFVIIGLAFWRIRKNPLFSLCIFAFYVTLLPVSQIIPFLDVKAERFLYIPSIFYCLILSLPLKYFDRAHENFRAIILLFLTLVVLYGSLSFSYSTLFRSERSLWNEMIQRAPENKKFHYNLSMYLWKKGEGKKAIDHLERVLELDKYNVRAYDLLGVFCSLTGKGGEARRNFLTGLRLDPRDVKLNLNYAVFNYHIGDFKKAYKYIKQAEKSDPKNEEVLKTKKEIEKKLKKGAHSN